MRKPIICLLLCALLLTPCCGALASGVTLCTFTPFADVDFAAQAYMDLITEWETITGNLARDYSGLTDEDWIEQMRAMIRLGDADLLVLPAGTGLTGSVAVTVQEMIEETDALGARIFSSMAERDGSVLLTPLRLNWEALYVNLDVLESAGLSAPETFDDLIDICRTLSGQGVLPVANALGDWAEIALDCAALMGAPQEAYGTEASRTGAQAALQALADAGAFEGCPATDAEAESLFIGGKAALRFDADGLSRRIPAQRHDRVIVVNVPGMDGEKRTAVAGTPSFGLTFTRDCWDDPKKREAALTLARRMLIVDTAMPLVTDAQGALGKSIFALTTGATDCAGLLYDFDPAGFDAWAKDVVAAVTK